MAEPDLDAVYEWLTAHPGTGLTADDVPGASAEELSCLASLGRVAGALLTTARPELRRRRDLVDFCGGSKSVADWFTSRACPKPSAAIVATAGRLLMDDGEDGLARLYARIVSPQRRRRLGTFFTPQLEVSRMIQAWHEHGNDPATVVDVGAGVGIYTVAAAERWNTARIHAVDVNPVTLGLLALRVATLAASDEELSGLGQNVRVVHDDYAAWVTTCWRKLPGPRLVLGNPPYTRMQLLPDDVRLNLTAKAGGLLGRRASLAALMTAVTLRLLEPADGLCLLLPAQWLESDYASEMRRWLWESRKRRIELRLFSSELFKDAEVDTVSLLVGPETAACQPMSLTVHGSGGTSQRDRDVPCPDQWRALFASSETTSSSALVTPQPDLEATGTSGVTSDDLASATLAGALRRSSKSADLVLLDGKVRLGDLATVSRGVATGANWYFVLTEDERRDLGLSKTVVRPLLRRLRACDKVRSGALTFDPDSETDRAADRTAAELCWLLVSGPDSSVLGEYFEVGKQGDVHKSHLASKRPDWFDLTTQVRNVDVVISPMSKGVFRILQAPPRAQILNNLYGLRWNDDVDGEVRDHVLEFLKSPAGQGAVQALARTQAKGLFKIEPRSLASLELPTTR